VSNIYRRKYQHGEINLYFGKKKNMEAIVLSIESGELDVDLLTDKVKRASELIAFCKEKLTKNRKRTSENPGRHCMIHEKKEGAVPFSRRLFP